MKHGKMFFVAMGAKIVVMAFCLLIVGLHYYLKGKLWVDPMASDQTYQEVKVQKDIDTYDANGFTQLMLAASIPAYKKMRALIKVGAEVNLQSKHMDPERKKIDGNTALHFALWNGSSSGDVVNVVKLLVKNGADVRIKNMLTGDTPLTFAMQVQDIPTRLTIAKMLIKHGADINDQNDMGYGMLHLAVEKRDRDWVGVMFRDFGSLLDLSLTTKPTKNPLGQVTPGKTAKELCYDAKSGLAYLPDIVRFFDAGPTIISGKARDAMGLTGLMLAVIRGDAATVDKMVKDGADVNAKVEDSDANTALHLACYFQNPSMIKLLVDKGAKVNEPNSYGDTPVHYLLKIADFNKCIEALKYLIDKGGDLNAQNRNGNTLLYLAVEDDNFLLINELLTKYGIKIEINIKNELSKTALARARELGNVRIVEMLESFEQIAGKTF